MNTRTRFTATLTLSTMLAAGALLATTSAASAAPTDCTLTYGSTWAQSLCTGGTGEHRVNMLQRHFDPTAGPILCQGPWAPVGTVSYTTCAPHTIVNVWISTR